jgi:hypothetical protein
VNAKKVIDELRNGESEISPTMPRSQNLPILKSPDKAVLRQTTVDLFEDAFHKPLEHLKNPVDFLKKQFNSQTPPPRLKTDEVATAYQSMSSLTENFRSPHHGGQITPQNVGTLYSILSLLTAWGVDTGLDEKLKNMGMTQPLRNLLLGFRG